jgi:hypothetical protein
MIAMHKYASLFVCNKARRISLRDDFFLPAFAEPSVVLVVIRIPADPFAGLVIPGRPKA